MRLFQSLVDAKSDKGPISLFFDVDRTTISFVKGSQRCEMSDSEALGFLENEVDKSEIAPDLLKKSIAVLTERVNADWNDE